jgi:hypothetical protein
MHAVQFGGEPCSAESASNNTKVETDDSVRLCVTDDRGKISGKKKKKIHR